MGLLNMREHKVCQKHTRSSSSPRKGQGTSAMTRTQMRPCRASLPQEVTSSAFALVVDDGKWSRLLDDFFSQYGYPEFYDDSYQECLAKNLIGKHYRLIAPDVLDEELLSFEWQSFFKEIERPALILLKISNGKGSEIIINETMMSPA